MMEHMQNHPLVPEDSKLGPQPDPQMVSTVTAAVLQTLQETGALPTKEGSAPVDQKPEEKTIDLIGLFFAIVEKIWLVVICAVMGALIMAGFSNTAYTATAKLYVVDTSSGGISIANLQLGTALMQDYQEVFKNWEVHEMVIEELELPYTYDQMQSMLSVSNPKDTRALYITVAYPDAKMAADIANTYAKAAQTFIVNTMHGEELIDFSMALEPSVDDWAASFSRVATGFMLGSVLAMGLITVLYMMDHRPRSPEEIEVHGGIPTLAVLPAQAERKKRERSGVNSRAPGSQKLSERPERPEGLRDAPYLEISNFPEMDFAGCEAMNTLCTKLSYCGTNVRKIIISSRYDGEGKTYVSMNLMRTAAKLGRRVVLVDTDLRTSGIQAGYRLRYSRDKHYGLSEYLTGLCTLKDIIYQTNISGAYMIPAGHAVPDPVQLLDTERMQQLMAWLGDQFDLALIDTPPVGVLVDAVALAKFCDGALLVVGYRKGSQHEIGEVVKHMKMTGCKMLGAVLNGVKFHSLSNRYHYFSSGRYAVNYSKRYK